MPVRRRSLALIASTCLVVLAGCGSSGDGTGSPEDQRGNGTTETVRVFATEGEQFKPVEHQVPADEAPEAAARALLDAPASQTYIPKDTRVNKVEVSNSGEAVVDFSDGFLGGYPGRSGPADTSPEGSDKRDEWPRSPNTLTSLRNVDEVRVQSGGIGVSSPKDRADFSEPDRVPAPPGRGSRYGSRSTGARSLQQKLADLGYLPASGVDGAIGYQTEQAVMAFQGWEGLVRDGVAGPVTRTALETAKRPRPSARRPKRLMEVRIGRGVLMLVRAGVPFAPSTSLPVLPERHPDRALRGVSQGVDVLVGSVQRLATVRLVFQQWNRLPRVPGCAALPGIAWLREGTFAGGPAGLPLRPDRNDRGQPTWSPVRASCLSGFSLDEHHLRVLGKRPEAVGDNPFQFVGNHAHLVHIEASCRSRA